METLRYVVLANGLLAIVTVAYFALLRRETFFGANRLALWLGLAASLVLPLLELPDWRPQPVRTVMQRTAQAIVPKVLPNLPTQQPDVTITYPNGQTYRAFSAQAQEFVWSWPMTVVAVYAGVVLLLLLRFGIRLASLLRLIQRSVYEEYDDFTLVQNETVSSPFSFFGWVVLNPASHTRDELDQILRHERVHVRAGHSFDMMGAELVCILLWFNPAAYLFRHLLQQTLEFAADRAVLAEGVDARTYQYNLLKVSLSSEPPSLTNSFNKSFLKPRIAMINRSKSETTTWLKYPVLVLATLTVATLFARPKAQTLAKVMPRRAATVMAQVIGTEPTPTSPDAKPVQLEAVTVSATPLSQSVTPAATFVDTNQQPTTSPDSGRVSSSRYVQYVGNTIYWVITPKTSIDDFALINQELSKYGRKMQLNEVRYDLTYSYIDRIAFTIVNSSTGYGVGYNGVNGGVGMPISSYSGFIGIGAKATIGGPQNLPNPDNTFPEALRKVAADEERAAKELYKAELNKEQLPERLVQAGRTKFGLFSNLSVTYNKEYIVNANDKDIGLLALPNGSLVVNENFKDVSVYINNLPVEREAVGMWTINQLYKVIVQRQVNPQSQYLTTTGLFIYAVED